MVVPNELRSLRHPHLHAALQRRHQDGPASQSRGTIRRNVWLSRAPARASRHYRADLHTALRRIREDPQNSIALPRQVAADGLEGWFDHLANKENAEDILQDDSVAVTELFLTGDDEIRYAIETGFLEHVCEQSRLRGWFYHWADDDRLREACQHALDWGEAHPDYIKGLRDRLRAWQSHEEQRAEFDCCFFNRNHLSRRSRFKGNRSNRSL